MKVKIQFPPQGIDVDVVGITADGQKVELAGLEITPHFYRPDVQVPIAYGRVLSEQPGIEQPQESHRFTTYVAGATGMVRMVTKGARVASQFEATGTRPSRKEVKPKKSEKSEATETR